MINSSSSQPNNDSTPQNPVGRFMVAVGAVIQHRLSGKILVIQRSSKLDWHAGEWEIDYGRIDQFEDPEQGLHREIAEETGITELEVGQILRVWHLYRGSKLAENDLIGITYVAYTNQDQVALSDEHQAYRWVTAEEALNIIKQPGIQEDILRFQKYSQST